MSPERGPEATQPNKSLPRQVFENVIAENGPGGDTIAGRASAVLGPAVKDAFARARNRFGGKEKGPTKVNSTVTPNEGTNLSSGDEQIKTEEVIDGSDSQKDSKGSGLSTAAKVVFTGAAIGLVGALAESRRRNVAKSEKESKHSVRNIALAGLATGMAMGFGDGLRTVLLEHRENTHQSIKLHPKLRRGLEFMGRSLMVRDGRLWPDAHLDHHAFADVSVFPFLKISRAIDWVEQQKEAGNDVGVEIPSHFYHLDPKREKYSQAKVREIGRIAEDHVKEKLGSHYIPPSSYEKNDLEEIFHATQPDYAYKPYENKKRGDYTSDETAIQVLQDPHSPLYADKEEKNGVKKILRTGLWPFLSRTSVSKAYPEIISPHAEQAGKPKSVWPAVTAGVLAPGVATLLIRGKYEPKDFALAAATSAVATGTRVGFVGVGSMAVNGMGHAGEKMTPKTMWKAAVGKVFDIQTKVKGTLATDMNPRWLLWPLHLVTSDEILRQKFHHDNPEKDKYTDHDGLQGIIEAPVGSAIHAIAESNSTLIQHGEHFGLKPGERRPDEPHPATILIMAERDMQREYDKAREPQTTAAESRQNSRPTRLEKVRKVLSLTQK